MAGGISRGFGGYGFGAVALGALLCMGLMLEAAAQVGRPRTHGVAPHTQAPQHRPAPGVASPNTPVGVQVSGAEGNRTYTTRAPQTRRVERRGQTGRIQPERQAPRRLRHADQRPGPVRGFLRNVGLLPEGHGSARPVSSRRAQTVEKRMRRAQTVESRQARARQARPSRERGQGLRRLLPWNLVSISKSDADGAGTQ